MKRHFLQEGACAGMIDCRKAYQQADCPEFQSNKDELRKVKAFKISGVRDKPTCFITLEVVGGYEYKNKKKWCSCDIEASFDEANSYVGGYFILEQDLSRFLLSAEDFEAEYSFAESDEYGGKQCK